MKITFLNHNLSTNCLARTYQLAKVLSKKYEVEIIGCKVGNRIWPPADIGTFEYKYFEEAKFPRSISKIREILRKISGDVIYVQRTAFSSYGIALIKKISSRTPVILDIDDWGLSFASKSKHRNKIIGELLETLKFGRSLLRFLYNPLRANSFATFFLEKLVPLSDSITVGNKALKDKFGGIIVDHPKDMSFFNPSLYKEKKTLRDNKKISFIGTPRPHKGVEVLIDAMSLIKDQPITFLLASFSDNEYVKVLRKKAINTLGQERVDFRVVEDFNLVPELYSITDISVIPSLDKPPSRFQIPQKVLDAMAMAKPIIATCVSDLPEILDGCGYIVEPGNPELLADKIKYVLDNPKESKEMGLKARKKCQEKYSYEAIEKILVNIFKKFE